MHQQETQTQKKPKSLKSLKSSKQANPNPNSNPNPNPNPNPQPTQPSNKPKSPASGSSITSKKYSLKSRMQIISRIKNLDKQTMRQFFKKINFSKGESLDFKVMQDQRILKIQKQLIQYERIHEEKVEKINAIKKRNNEGNLEENSEEEEFQIQKDEDYED